MPLTKHGRKALRNMKEHYDSEKGKSVFYASMNKGNPGSSKWHQVKKAKHRRQKH